MSYAEPPWVRRYIGVPFVKRGNTPAGWHCWGCDQFLLTKHAGLKDVPDGGPLSALDVEAAANAMQMARALPPWNEILHRQPNDTGSQFARRAVLSGALRLFDVVLMTRPWKGREIDGHVGIMINPYRMLHVEAHCDTVKVALDDANICGRLRGFYRHDALV